MANTTFKNGAGSTEYNESSGAGTNGDPKRMVVTAREVPFQFRQTLTVTNGAYVVADVVGGLITITGVASAAGKSAWIEKVTLCGVVANPYELWLFDTDVADTAIADADPLTIAAADGLLYQGHIAIAISDYVKPVGTFQWATVKPGHKVKTAATTSLYAYLKATAVTSPGTTTLYLCIEGTQID